MSALLDMNGLLTRLYRKFPALLPLAQRLHGVRYGLRALGGGVPGARNYLRCAASALCGSEASAGMPHSLIIEPVNFCDQQCTICETGLGILGRKPQRMSLDEFRRILDAAGPDLRTILLYGMGETFLNDAAYDMIRMAADRGIHVSVCTNGNRLDAEALARSGVAEVQFQISGLTQQTHAIYRVGGVLEKTLHHARETLRWRAELDRQGAVHRPYPMRISLGFIAFRHNEHEISGLAALARDTGVDRHEVIAPCVRTIEQARELLPADPQLWIYDRQAYDRGELLPRVQPHNFCASLYGGLSVHVNGDVVPCCRDPHGRFVIGNLLQQPMHEIWNGNAMRTVRRNVARAQRSFPLCALCSGYTMSNLPPAPAPRR